MSTRVFYYQHQCRNGVVVGLLPEPNGRYKVMYGDENLGSYHSAAAALDDLVGGHTFFPADGTDPSKLGIPDELSEWQKKHFAEFKKMRPA